MLQCATIIRAIVFFSVTSAIATLMLMPMLDSQAIITDSTVCSHHHRHKSSVTQQVEKQTLTVVPIQFLVMVLISRFHCFFSNRQ